MIRDAKEKINQEKDHSEMTVSFPSLNEPLCTGWNGECDKSLVIGVYKHGLEGLDNCVTDDKLVFASIPSVSDSSLSRVNSYRRGL